MVAGASDAAMHGTGLTGIIQGAFFGAIGGAIGGGAYLAGGIWPVVAAAGGLALAGGTGGVKGLESFAAGFAGSLAGGALGDYLNKAINSNVAQAADYQSNMSDERDADNPNATSPSDPENWNRVRATREGCVGGTTANGNTIGADDVFAALPSRDALDENIEIFYNGKTITAPVWDVGPWNTNDPYWLTGAPPQAESGLDMAGRVTNGAGVDLSNKVYWDLNVKGNDWVYWRFAK